MTVNYDAELEELISSIMKDFLEEEEEKKLLLLSSFEKLISREAHEGYFREKKPLLSFPRNEAAADVNSITREKRQLRLSFDKFD